MDKDPPKTCQICQRHFPAHKLFPAALLRPALVDEILKEHSDWTEHSYICPDDLAHYRGTHIQNLLQEEKGALSRLDHEVVQSFREHDLLTEDLNQEFEEKFTFGEKAADSLASFGGSWSFIIIFAAVLFSWMGINVVHVLSAPFDPFPFIFLNLILSCLAAIQAPIIMMSQNRQAKKDRIKADYEYTINLKSELQIRQLHSKLDQMMRDQWSRMLEIQSIQIDLLAQLNQGKD